MLLLEGKTLSNKILDALPGRIAAVSAASGREPALAIVNYFADSPSAVYVKRKMTVCARLGIRARFIKPEADTGLTGFLKLLKDLSADSAVDAVMIERPLPAAFEVPAIWDAIPPEKDVDALSSVNMGRLFISKTMADIERGGFFVPCSALAVIKLLNHYNIPVKGRKAAVAGRSAVVGKPLAHMLTALDATVTLCHTKTPDISAIFKNSDLVISAAGRARWLKSGMLHPGTIVIDAGTNMDETGKMCGDADFDSVKETAGALSPVPGGVGPVTLACLIEATVKAAEKQHLGKLTS
ncbi:MAG: bifunctional 5,10-methylenetetrahydrofolate dehydrogenase/5,10-methenyltetrahydrofolate cyclohydrolase [Elusimicrobia bacterium]|nr:bifunctional 5,10-methylenetetrahydrofolate dehydrogenase/5,10-methenyltetrahydrofolate cyclohydrolase [Elusimicrobiota bacterium]